MQQFLSAAHLASWTGICPGKHESAGKRLSGKPRKGSVWLRRSLCQAVWAASHTKDSYLAARFRRLAARKGKKRAIVAVAHEEQKRRERSDRNMRWIGWVVGGFFLTVMFRPAPIPWPVSLSGAGLLAWWGILGRCIFALYLTVDTAYLTLGKAFVDHYHTPLVLVTLALVVAATVGWRLRSSQDGQKTKKRPLLSPQAKQGNLR